MFAHIPNKAMLRSLYSRVPGSTTEYLQNLTMPKHYTSASFGRLLALAGRRLRLSTAHFRAALRAVIEDSGMIMANNLMQEQVSYRTPGIYLRRTYVAMMLPPCKTTLHAVMDGQSLAV